MNVPQIQRRLWLIALSKFCYQGISLSGLASLENEMTKVINFKGGIFDGVCLVLLNNAPLFLKDDLSGNDYGHRENRAFDDVTKGEYFVRLPDGRLQTVTYYVDPTSGFRATVAYDREVPAPAPASLPPARVFITPSNIPAAGITSSPANPATVRVPSPPIRPVILPSRKDKSLNAVFNAKPFNSNSNANLFLRPNSNSNNFNNDAVQLSSNNNAFAAPEVLASNPQPDVVQTGLRPEVPRRPKNRFLHETHRLNNLFQDDRKSKSEFNVHNKEAVTKTESELVGQDFSEPVFYPYEPKIVKHEDAILD